LLVVEEKPTPLPRLEAALGIRAGKIASIAACARPAR